MAGAPSSQADPGSTAHWHGLCEVRYLVIFGDSYSDVGYYPKPSTRPSEERPLGVTFPGITWNEDGKPNWVGYLLSELTPNHSFLVYDYAVGGQRVDGVVQQIQHRFIPDIGDKPDWAKWSSIDSLFVTWIGINDIAFIKRKEQINSSLETLFEKQVQLYELGARNFLFIDVPTVHRSPAVRIGRSGNVLELIIAWNARLRELIAQFTSTRPDATAFFYSSFDLFSKILDNPEAYGFSKSDIRAEGGRIWLDHIHPTTKVHREIARDIAEFLSKQ